MLNSVCLLIGSYTQYLFVHLIAGIKPNIACTAAGQCVAHATCDTTDTDTCVCDASYTSSPIISPTMCKLKSQCSKLAIFGSKWSIPLLHMTFNLYDL